MFRSLLTISLLLYSLTAASTESAKPVFDNRQWELGWSQAQEPSAAKDGTVFEEYVLKGETVQNWSELVTIQFFPGLNKRATLEEFEAANKKALLDSCPSAKWQSLSNTTDERFWEWNVKGCKAAPDQSEIVRVVKTENGIFVLHYAIKKSPMPEANKKTWDKNLKAIVIK